MSVIERLSIRTVLIGATLLSGLVIAALVGTIGVISIVQDVKDDAQEQVNANLDSINRRFHDQLDQLVFRLSISLEDVNPEDDSFATELSKIKESNGITVLNACRVDGTPLAGSHHSQLLKVPVEDDQVIKEALKGKTASGIMLLEESRLLSEGGKALINGVSIKREDGETRIRSALFWWIAFPVKDEAGIVQAIIYGGKTLNRDFELVDELRDVVVGSREFNGKPEGTVTIFLREWRIATNVVMKNRKRAIGTSVADDVAQKVLREGETWRDRAYVVDAWYLSGYLPLTNPDGEAVGMLYIGLLEAPYTDLAFGLVIRLLSLIALGGVLAIILAYVTVKKISAPLQQLSKSVADVTRGKLDKQLPEIATFAEFASLSRDFRSMQEVIAQRDKSLHEQNAELAKVNSNYMETLGFVTHELKSPLAAIQTMIDTIVQIYQDEVPEKARDFLLRIRRNCEELQEMVKNYLDLSRAERGELVPVFRECDVCEDIINAAVQQTKPLFVNRNIDLHLDCPAKVIANADPELMRIALSNFLSNAAKYGAERSKARLGTKLEGGEIIISVWNEGNGFTKAEKNKLFNKFSRLENLNTKGKRGSGLGLFLSKQVLEQHSGTVLAESEPGKWARFTLRFPQTR